MFASAAGVIASAHADGPQAGLARLDALAGASKLAHYALYHAARGDLLLKLDRARDAGEAFAKAFGCRVSLPERRHLKLRLQACERRRELTRRIDSSASRVE